MIRYVSIVIGLMLYALNAFADSTFAPWGPSYLVINANQLVSSPLNAPTSYRIVNLSSSVQYFSWGTASANVPTPAAPTSSAAAANTIGMLPLSSETFGGLPPNAYFQASTSTGFLITPGSGF